MITMNNVPLKVDFLKAEISRTFLPLEINLITMKNVPLKVDFLKVYIRRTFLPLTIND